MELRKLIRALSECFPFSSSEVWDHPGYQAGKRMFDKDIHKIMLCLDFEETGFLKALEFKPDLVLTHHPFLFGKRNDVLRHDPLKADLIIRIEEELNCPIYSYHTCFDKGIGGMNDTILSELGLETEKIGVDGLMRFALLPHSISVEELALSIKEKLHLPYAFYHQGAIEEINRIALIAGGGSSSFREALDQGADCYISGDCPHHTRLDLVRYEMNYIDVSHEIEEEGFLLGMGNALKRIDSEFDLLCYRFEKDFRRV